MIARGLGSEKIGSAHAVERVSLADTKTTQFGVPFGDEAFVVSMGEIFAGNGRGSRHTDLTSFAFRALRVSGSKLWGDSKALSKSRSLPNPSRNAQRGL
jgi:hypothetical protein